MLKVVAAKIATHTCLSNEGAQFGGPKKSCPSFFLSPNESTSVLPPRYRAFSSANLRKHQGAFVVFVDCQSGSFALHFILAHIIDVGLGVGECEASLKFVAVLSQPKNCTHLGWLTASTTPTVAVV